MARFEDIPSYGPKKGMVTAEEVQADVELSIVEDYNYEYGKEYKSLLKTIAEYEKTIVGFKKTLAEMKYEPPTF